MAQAEQSCLPASYFDLTSNMENSDMNISHFDMTEEDYQEIMNPDFQSISVALDTLDSFDIGSAEFPFNLILEYACYSPDA